MNKTCEWRQLQCIVLWNSRNLLFFSLKRHSGTNLWLKLPPSPCQTVRCRNDRQAGTRSWRVSGAAMGKIRYQWRKCFFVEKSAKNVGKFSGIFFMFAPGQENSQNFFKAAFPCQESLLCSHTSISLKKCEIFSQLLSFSYPYFTLNNL